MTGPAEKRAHWGPATCYCPRSASLSRFMKTNGLKRVQLDAHHSLPRVRNRQPASAGKTTPFETASALSTLSHADSERPDRI